MYVQYFDVLEHKKKLWNDKEIRMKMIKIGRMSLRNLSLLEMRPKTINSKSRTRQRRQNVNSCVELGFFGRKCLVVGGWVVYNLRCCRIVFATLKLFAIISHDFLFQIRNETSNQPRSKSLFRFKFWELSFLLFRLHSPSQSFSML